MIEALNWERQFYADGAREVEQFVLSFDRSMNSRHPVYVGERLSCRQCHRSAGPRNRAGTADGGFSVGKVAMMVAGQWLAGPEPGYGVGPLPPPAAHPERSNTSLVQGAVVIVPAGVRGKTAAARLLSWMMSPPVVAEEAYAHGALPASRTAAGDPCFQQLPHFGVFVDLLAHPNARHAPAAPVGADLNRALGQVEAEVLHEGGDPAALLNEVQAEFASGVRGALGYHDGP